MILGIDEVGRGPWAGPLVVGAVILGNVRIEGLNDSKKLTAKKRQALNAAIREQASVWSLGWVSARELDEIGMSEALRLACRRAVEQVQAQCHEKETSFSEIIIDGTVNFLRGTALEGYVTTIAKADGLIASVSAASIIAKVARDTYMKAQDAVYPGYGFASNVGYGTTAHQAGLERLGACAEHRLSFAPLRRYAAGLAGALVTDGGTDGGLVSTRVIGNAGEQAVAEWLIAEGHDIIARNWRTKWCEIDIISYHDNTLFFTEVKYRKNARYGDGLSAITADKQRRMMQAAALFLARHPQYGVFDAQLLAAAVTGEPPAVEAVVSI